MSDSNEGYQNDITSNTSTDDLLEAESTVDFDDATDIQRVEYDQTRTPTSLAVVAAVASCINKDPLVLDPLEEAIDADALDKLLDTGLSVGQVCFQYSGCEIRVVGNGVVEVAQG